MRIIICGGGIIGATTAYFLSKRGASVTVVERCALACGASGKGGGFLARDWCDGSVLGSLATRSYALHRELAELIGTDWGYRRLETFAGEVGVSERAVGRADLSWLARGVRVRGRLSSPGTTAQVQPALFTKAMMDAAIAHGAELRLGTVTDVRLDRSGGIDAVVIGTDAGTDILTTDAVVVAMGPWSQLARRWLKFPSVYGLKGHSILFQTDDAIPPEALFLDYSVAGRESYTPEIFPRPDGTTYVCAISSETPLPVDPAQVEPDPGAIEELTALAATISPVFAQSTIVARQACYRPVTPDGLPIIGAIPGTTGAYVATGHGPWGILNAPATGEAMAELVLDGRTRTVSLEAFAPGRAMAAR